MNKFSVTSLIAISLAAIGSAGFAAADSSGLGGCGVALKAVKLTSCVETPNGVALANSNEEAAKLASAASAGEEQFKRHFRTTPARYAVIMSTNREDIDTLEKAGFKNVLPWISGEQFQASAVRSLKMQIENSAKARGMSAEETAALVQKTLANFEAKNMPSRREETRGSVVAHELGHMWLISAYWPNAGHSGAHYGGPGPDWLDEMGAILMEDEKMTADRRKQFAEAYTGKTSNQLLKEIPKEKLIDLASFFTASHPARRSSRTIAPDPNQTSGVRISVVSSDDKDRVVSGVMFYLQARMVADYLMEKSGRADIFASLSKDISSGQSIDQWLQTSGKRFNLPSNLTAFEADWRNWLTAKTATIA